MGSATIKHRKKKTYTTNKLLAFVITILFIALIFTIDTDTLFKFYTDIKLTIWIVLAGLVMPFLAFFGFTFQIASEDVINTSYFFFKRRFKIQDISHVLYQPTWKGIMPMNTQTDMRSLHVVRNSGGWMQTISLANGAFREEDLADIVRELHEINPQIELDEYARALIKKYESPT